MATYIESTDIMQQQIISMLMAIYILLMAIPVAAERGENRPGYRSSYVAYIRFLREHNCRNWLVLNLTASWRQFSRKLKILSVFIHKIKYTKLNLCMSMIVFLGIYFLLYRTYTSVQQIPKKLELKKP